MVKLSLCWITQIHEVVLGTGVVATTFLTRHYMELSAQFHVPATYLHGICHWYPLDRGIGGLSRARLDSVENTKISRPHRKSNPIIQPVASRYTDWAIPALFEYNNVKILQLQQNAYLYLHNNFDSSNNSLSCNAWRSVSSNKYWTDTC
jgi:hypothetical protein